MNTVEYGKALFLLADEESISDRIRSEGELIKQVLAENPKYITLLDTPSISGSEKHALLDAAFKDLHPHLLNFLKILVTKRCIYLFPRMLSAYCAAYDEKNNILHASAVTAVEMTAAQKESLTKKLSDMTRKTVVLQCIVDPSVIGGVKLQFDGKQLDSSMEAQLASIRTMLKQTNL
jgi:F-type H+-transporting ATPase subunit delta